jgi:hypothetical protein
MLSIVDVASLLVHSVGLPIPSDLEGRVPVEIFTSDFCRAHPVNLGEPTQPVVAYPVSSKDSALPEDEEAAVLSRLKNLGYVE